MRYVEDPYIASAARVEHAVMATELIDRYAGGEDFFAARTAIMATHGPRIARECGKDTAERAMRALMSYGPEAMPADAERQRRAHLSRTDVALMNDLFGEGHRIPRARAITDQSPGAGPGMMAAGIGILFACPLFLIAVSWQAVLAIAIVGLLVSAAGFWLECSSASMIMPEGRTASPEAFERRVAAADAEIDRRIAQAEQAKAAAADQRATSTMLRDLAAKIERDNRALRNSPL